MNHRGELSEIAAVLGHDVAVITNIGSAHIGNLGSREEIANAKCEILRSSKPLRALIPHGERLLAHVDGTTVGVNCDAECSLLSKDGYFAEYRSARLRLTGIKIELKGAHIPECLSFAIAVADILGVSQSDICKALEKPSCICRETKIARVGGLRIIDDGYNASYESILCALKTLAREDGRKIAVIGDVLELGDLSDDIHYAIGKACALSGISALFTFGGFADKIALGAYSSGMKKDTVFINANSDDPEKTARDILGFAKADDIILFKASHSTGIGRIIDEIKNL
jgi:UDP-N-acetylmuramoyl-tripeptide--D-alanyl-D-alanine ligase